MAGPSDDERLADAAFVEPAFTATQSAGAATIAFGFAVAFGAVVSSEEDDRVVGLANFIQYFHKSSKGGVHLRGIAIVLAMAFVDFRVECLELRIGFNGLMRFVRTNIEQKRLLGIAMMLGPVDGFIDHETGRSNQ